VSCAYVTGGSGFLGGALVRQLVADGRHVVALARSDEAAAAVRELGAEPARGDVLDPASVRAGMDGCDVVFHLGGVNTFCLADPTPMLRTNVAGSRNVVEAAAAVGARRVVYTSSAAVLGESSGSVGSEDSPHRGWFLSAYERSKFEAEREVLRVARERRVDVVCVNPSSVQGPGRTGGTAKLLLDYLNGKLPFLPEARLSIVDVDDCTAGHLLAEAHGVSGRRYVLSGATLTTREAVRLLGEVSGTERAFRPLPRPLALPLAAAVESIARTRGRKPKLCREMMRTVLHGHAYDGSRAERELGLRYTPIAATLRRTLEWYAEQGYLPRLPTKSATRM
jgi:dihydroflavonol-4-reductase